MFGHPADINVHPYAQQSVLTVPSFSASAYQAEPNTPPDETFSSFFTPVNTNCQKQNSVAECSSFKNGHQVDARHWPPSVSSIRDSRTTKSAASLHSNGFCYGDDERHRSVNGCAKEKTSELINVDLDSQAVKPGSNLRMATENSPKTSVSTPTLATLGSPLQLPYRYHCRISATDYCIMALMVPIVPLRVAGLLFLMISGWLIAKVALFNINKTNDLLTAAPLTGWRRKCQIILRHIGRWMFFLCGLHWIRWEGRVEELLKRRKGQEVQAPVLVVAPHISYMDAFLCVIMDCCVVSRSSLKSLPFFGPAISLMQPLYVDREDMQSRISTVEALRERCRKDITLNRWNWPPVFIFPEGTTSNGKSFFKFKSGAFIPGQPVQLIGLSYKTCMRSFQPVTMTWDTNLPVWKSLVCILLQPNITAIVTALGVYCPSQDEKLNPDLYTANVERYMSLKLGLPATEYTFQHAKNYAATVHYKREAAGDRSSANSSTETVAATDYQSRTRGRKHSFRV
ncbi:lysophosphatidylcholine acyltransferase 1-like [Paramacrobiotus metropolitanus]|uniref:lysophosphatidylcholine acyltransferase 1-like n=1 Tax=Paramacrobiotus metropolitanus TaxID=2943436 RepID=UPI0024462EAC|nr:lysophosphatidylcholine acyltransferase 1-like [Paramacrobiotus metropolitanus]